MDTNLLQKFYKGTCTEEEAQKVINWFSSKEDKEMLLNQLQADWQDFDIPEEEVTAEEIHDGYHPDRVLHTIHTRLREEADSEAGDHTIKPINTNRFYCLRVAAIMVLAFGLSFLMQKMMPAEHVSEINSYVVKEVPMGQKQTIMLADGTKVILNADSRLSYPEAFLENKREVRLEGEAFFEVARDEKRPFTISSGDVCTTVLGTSFNVKAYKDEQDITVSVASGKVKVNKVNHADQAHYLSPGREAIYQLDKQSFTVQDFEAKETLAWKEGILYFKDATFEEVKKALERWYGVEIQVIGRDSQDWQYSGAFHRQSLENVLLSIGYVKYFTYAMDGKQVKIIFNNS